MRRIDSFKISLVALAAVLVLAGAAGASMIGGTSGAYLRPSVGATALALGGAYAAMPDYLAPWWNPAVLSQLRERRAAAGAGLRSLGRTEGYGSFEFRVPPRAGMGLLALYRGDPFLGDLYDSDERPLGRATYTTMTTKIALSYIATRSVSVGANIGILYQSLPTTPDGGGLTNSSTTGIGALDLAVAYRVADYWSTAFVVQNLNAAMNWEIASSASLSPTIEDRLLPVITVASRFEKTLSGRPFIWFCDLKGYLVDGEWHRLTYPEAVLNSGWEWRYWDNFFLRAGLGDIALNRDIVRNPGDYFDVFSFRVATGFSWDLSRYRNGLRLNYGASTDKIWAGIDQQLDISLAF